MKRKFLIIGLAMGSLGFSQNSLPNVQDVSWVLGSDTFKYVVSLLDTEIYNDKLNTSIERDTFIVSKIYPLFHLIDETEWENCMNCDEID